MKYASEVYLISLLNAVKRNKSLMSKYFMTYGIFCSKYVLSLSTMQSTVLFEQHTSCAVSQL